MDQVIAAKKTLEAMDEDQLMDLKTTVTRTTVHHGNTVEKPDKSEKTDVTITVDKSKITKPGTSSSSSDSSSDSSDSQGASQEAWPPGGCECFDWKVYSWFDRPSNAPNRPRTACAPIASPVEKAAKPMLIVPKQQSPMLSPYVAEMQQQLEATKDVEADGHRVEVALQDALEIGVTRQDQLVKML